MHWDRNNALLGDACEGKDEGTKHLQSTYLGKGTRRLAFWALGKGFSTGFP